MPRTLCTPMQTAGAAPLMPVRSPASIRAASDSPPVAGHSITGPPPPVLSQKEPANNLHAGHKTVGSVPNPPPHESENVDGPVLDESQQARIERLGRERPPCFASGKKEMGFVFSIIMSQFLTEYFVSGFTVILPTLIRELEIPQASSVWPATAFSIVIASTLLVFGRLGDMWGGQPVFLWGLAWLCVWSIIAGFSINPLMLDMCRALQGLGAAAFLPTGVMLMGATYRPGPRKNLVFSIYGTSAVLGFFGGIFVAGAVGQYLRWGFYFWIGAMLAAVTLLASILSIPRSRSDDETSKTAKMDYLGALFIILGLGLTVFALTESARASSGWATPYIPVCLVVGIISLFAAAYIETHVDQPLLSSCVFTTPAMTPLLLAIFLLYGTWGIFSLYGTLFFQDIYKASPFQVVAWYVPLGVVGLVLSILEGLILHILPGRVLLIVSGLGAVGSQLLLAFLPATDANYWAWIFPATIFATIGIDLATILMTVFVTTQFSAKEQGLAGGVINSVLQLGVAFSLGVADIIQSATVDDMGLVRSYKNTFWFGVASAIVSLTIMAVWGRVPQATSDLTADEKAELIREAAAQETLRPT